jgi:putative DNA primase/helicase
VVIVDKDAPGRKHGRSVATALHSVVKSVKLIELPDRDGKSVKDAADWFAAGGTGEETRAIVKAAPEFAPAPIVTTTTAANIEVQIHSDWPDPQPLPESLPSVLSFDFRCLPDTLRPWLEDISERMQCPADFAAVGAMLALGSLIGRKIGICPKQHDDWLVIPNLWGYIVGRPGLMKSPALEQALAPLRRLGIAELERYEAVKKEHAANAMLEKQRAKLTEQSINKRLRDGDEAAARKEALSIVSNPYSEPTPRRYEVNDSTVEKLGELLAQNPNGLLVYRDELAGFLRGLDREGNEHARAIYLEAWNGTGEFTYDRIGRGTIRVPSNTISIAGGIQPGVLAAYVREAVVGGSGADGLLPRFQVAVFPDPPKGWRNVDRWPDTKLRTKPLVRSNISPH